MITPVDRLLAAPCDRWDELDILSAHRGLANQAERIAALEAERDDHSKTLAVLASATQWQAKLDAANEKIERLKAERDDLCRIIHNSTAEECEGLRQQFAEIREELEREKSPSRGYMVSGSQHHYQMIRANKAEAELAEAHDQVANTEMAMASLTEAFNACKSELASARAALRDIMGDRVVREWCRVKHAEAIAAAREQG